MNTLSHRLRVGPLEQTDTFVVAYGEFVGAERERVTAIAPKDEWREKVAVEPGEMVLIGPDAGQGLTQARTHLLLMLVDPPRALDIPRPPVTIEEPVMLHAVVMFPPAGTRPEPVEP